MCLQSCPLAGNVIVRYVMGHFRDNLIVCSSHSPPIPLLLIAADDTPGCTKLRLTATETQQIDN